MKKLFSSLFLTLALGVLLGAFCDGFKVYASEIPDNAKDIFISDLEDIGYSYSTYQSYYDIAFSFDYVTRIKSGSNFCWIFQKYEFAGIGVGTSGTSGYFSINNTDNSWGSAGLRSIDNFYVMNLPTNIPIQYTVSFINNNFYLSYYYIEYSNPSNANWFQLAIYPSNSYSTMNGKYNNTNPNCSRIVGGVYDSSTNFKFEDVITNHNFYYQDYSLGNGFLFEDNWEENFPSSVEDDRLEIYTTYQANDVKLLNIDLSKFRTGYSAAVSKTFSDVTVNVNCDGVDETFVLSSSTSSIVDIFSASNEVYTLITPYSFFNLDQFEDVYISSLSFGLTTSSAGGSGTENFNIACQYYLKQEHIPLEPEVIPDPEYNDTSVYTDQQITDMKSDLHEASSRFSFISGDWIFVSENDLPTFPGWATVFTNYVWFGDVNSDTTYKGHWFQMANNIPSIADLSRPFDPSAFIEENKTFAFYDVILLKVYTVGISVDLNLSTPAIQNYSLAGYLVFISDRYYDHYNAEINLDIVKQLQLSAENSVLFYEMLKSRLDDLAGDMDSGFNSLTDLNDGTQYKIIGWLKTLDTNITSSFNTLGSTLNSGFSSVVSAINNISIPSSGSSYSLPALSDELEYLFKPSLEWSAINYNDYVESLGVLALPFEFTFDVLDIAENQYDSDLKLHINQLSVDLPLEAGSDPETTSFSVLSEQDIDFEPTSVVPAALWSTLQYLNAFGLVLVQALGTYNHIFRGGDK